MKDTSRKKERIVEEKEFENIKKIDERGRERQETKKSLRKEREKERKKIKEIITNKKRKVKEERGENNYINVPSFPGELASTFDGFPGGERSIDIEKLFVRAASSAVLGSIDGIDYWKGIVLKIH